MRILITSVNRVVVGGAERHLRTLIPGLRERGHEVALVYDLPPSPGDPTIDQGWEAFPSWHVEPGKGPELLTKLRSWQPDVVYSHGLSDANLEGALIDSFPGVLCAHSYYGTCISGTKYRARSSGQACTRRLGPACLALYLPCRCGGRSPITMWKHYRHQRRRQALLPRYRRVLVASRYMHGEYARHGLEPSRLHLVPHFPAELRPDPQPPRPRSLTGRILFVGRLTSPKGGHVLIEALALFGQRYTLVVAGSGADSGPLQELARQRGVRAEFLGRVDDAELDRQRRQADLLAAPSLWPEPFGIVGIEAGCVGLPTVGFLNGGMADWLIPGQTGEAPPKDQMTPAGFAQAIERALADADHYQRLRVGAWQMAQRFTLERHLDLLLPLLKRAGQGSYGASLPGEQPPDEESLDPVSPIPELEA